MESHVDLYEALKPFVGEEGARLIASVVPPASDLATKADIEGLRADVITRVEQIRAELTVRIEETRAEVVAQAEGVRTDLVDRIGRVEARVFRAGLLFFLPMWVSVWGALLTMLLRG